MLEAEDNPKQLDVVVDHLGKERTGHRMLAQRVPGAWRPWAWPVLELAASYAAWWAENRAMLAGLGHAERAAVLGGNAGQVYRR